MRELLHLVIDGAGLLFLGIIAFEMVHTHWMMRKAERERKSWKP